jgi:hypothetical protein
VAEYLSYWLDEIIKPNRAPLTMYRASTQHQPVTCIFVLHRFIE